MKRTLRYTCFLIAFICLLGVENYKAQLPCIANFSYMPGPGGTVSFTTTSVPTAGGSSYSWFFGNGAQLINTASTVAATTYTSNGSYVVTLTMTNTTNTCTATVTQTITVSNICSLQIAYTPPNPPNACNGSATVTSITGVCAPVSYTWSNGVFSPTTGSLCQNVIYTVTAAGPTGTSCCTFLSDTTLIPYVCNLSPSFSGSIGGGGQVSFTSTSTGTVPGVSYIWKFGDGTPNASGSYSTTHTYTSNGIYPVWMVVNNNYGACRDSISFTYTITNAPCNMTPSFTFSAVSGGSVNFSSTSAGTGSNTIYSWNFGDGVVTNFTPTAVTANHVYTLNGNYVVTLQLSNTAIPGCTASISQTLQVSTVPVPCNLVTSFIYTISLTGLASFTNTSSGTNPGTTYIWNFGDGSSPTSFSLISTHQYTTSGIKTVVLTANNNTIPTCTFSQSQFIIVPCTLTATFQHTVGASGQVSFKSTSTGTNLATSYIWDFGDGVYTSGSAPIHTYINAGAYNVKLKILNGNTLCQDSILQSINVTGISCLANSNFTLSATNTPQYWNATPSYPWNVSTASWDWGDGSTSNGLYTSHIYASAGNYNICLTITVSCGATGSTCASYAVYRSQGSAGDLSMVYVNVTRPGLSTSLENALTEQVAFAVYPNPNSGNFSMNATGLTPGAIQVNIYNLVGEQVYTEALISTDGNFEKDIQLQEPASGMYLLKISSGSTVILKKIVINK